eukprot:COSAG05_NODE_2495_length_2983_cov_12.675535_2_plen_63_part_00
MLRGGKKRRVVLVGHSLENDLRALKLCHGLVIDTAVCFPTGTPVRPFYIYNNMFTPGSDVDC